MNGLAYSMASKNMRSLISRLQRLEARTGTDDPIKCRIGPLRALPSTFVGERHIVIVKRSPARGSVESCEFEERPGPQPEGPIDVVPRIYFSEVEMRL